MLKIFVFAVLVLQLNVAIAASTQWDHLKNDSLEVQVKLSNNSYRELIGSTEFLTRVDLMPYGFDNQPIDMTFDLTYRTFMPRRVRVGEITYFTQQIPIQYAFESSLELKEVAYFKARFRIIEDDFFFSQNVVDFMVKLTPFGILGFNKVSKQVSYSNNVMMRTVPHQKVEAHGRFTLGLAQSALVKVKKDKAVLEARIRRLLDEVKTLH